VSGAPFKHQAGILWSSFGPYHIARIEAAAKALESENCGLTAFRFTEKSDTYSWDAESPRSNAVVTLSDGEARGFATSISIARRFFKELRARKIDCVFMPSFSPLPNALCLFTARAAGCRIVLMTESWKATGSNHIGSRFLKRILVSLCHSALVGGTPQMEYLTGLGMGKELIFQGYDVVDVEFFRKAADGFRKDRSSRRENLNTWLPSRYFLSLGRYVKKKNLGLIIDSYSMLKRERFPMEIRLVMVGNGPQELELKQMVTKAGLEWTDVVGLEEPDRKADVYFYPFQQIEKTPRFFALAEAFILPSLWEEWGLVVNEAMACGTPVLVSRNVGAGFDLIENGKNGWIFDPKAAGNLKELLLLFCEDPTLRGRMGAAGAEKIRDWGLERFGESALGAWRAAQSG